MRAYFLLIAFSILFTINHCLAYTVTIAPNDKECFFEDLHHDDKMTITYQVGDGGNMDIDFLVMDPADNEMESSTKQSTRTFSFTAKLDGRYTYCFSNVMSTVTEKVVSFNIHGVLYMPDDDGSIHTDPLEKEIRELADGLEAIKDEQEYIVMRERTHRDTAESTNDRVKWWSIFQFLVLFA
ncbi:13838_t:CDS:2, partial [Entrophospora sp. SA101]